MRDNSHNIVSQLDTQLASEKHISLCLRSANTHTHCTHTAQLKITISYTPHAPVQTHEALKLVHILREKAIIIKGELMQTDAVKHIKKKKLSQQYVKQVAAKSGLVNS